MDNRFATSVGDRFLSSAGAGGNCARPMRLPDPSPVLDKNRAPMGPEILSSTGARVWRKAPMAIPYSSSVLDKFQFATSGRRCCTPPVALQCVAPVLSSLGPFELREAPCESTCLYNAPSLHIAE